MFNFQFSILIRKEKGSHVCEPQKISQSDIHFG